MSLNCPACNTNTLDPVEDPITGLVVDSCSACSGIWFDDNELARFLESGKMKHSFHLDEKPRANESSITINTTPRRCPRCGVDMDGRLFGGVTLDRCARCHGLWFDGGELQVVVARYRKGGKGDREIAHELRVGLSDSDATAKDDGRDAVLESVEAFLASITQKKNPN